MKFPKKKVQKKRKTHKESILHKKDGTCYLCMKLHEDYRIHAYTHRHHAFDAANRPISEQEGFTVNLCPEHHIYGPEAVHKNYDNMRLIQQDAQRGYEKSHTREQFIQLIGRNYL